MGGGAVGLDSASLALWKCVAEDEPPTSGLWRLAADATVAHDAAAAGVSLLMTQRSRPPLVSRQRPSPATLEERMSALASYQTYCRKSAGVAALQYTCNLRLRANADVEALLLRIVS